MPGKSLGAYGRVLREVEKSEQKTIKDIEAEYKANIDKGMSTEDADVARKTAIEKVYEDYDYIVFCGEKLHLQPEIGAYAAFDYALHKMQKRDKHHPQTLVSQEELVEACLVPEDFRTFIDLARQNKITTEELEKLSDDLFVEVTGSPLFQPSASSPTDTDDSQTLNGKSLNGSKPIKQQDSLQAKKDSTGSND